MTQIDKTRTHHQKSLTKTRKMQRELKNFGKQSFRFSFFDADTGTYLGSWDFVAFDSEEAFMNADAWAGRNPIWNYISDIHVEQE